MDKRRSRPSSNQGRKGNKKLVYTKKTGRPYKEADIKPEQKAPAEIRLNRFIASSGVCSRREADQLISDGRIKVNGKVVTTLGSKVKPGDKVFFGNKELKPQKQVYFILNKPKDFITTTDDPRNRKTVMDLLSSATKERIFPVGRLDRNTTGLLLFTNDGDLAKKLSHPSHGIKKIYHITLDKPLSPNHLASIQEGITLEDGLAKVDEIVVLSEDLKEIGLEIHIGKNRIVRRIFEHLGYEVSKLDRVSYAGLTKKDLPRGKWRELSSKEVIRLKHF